MARILGLVVAIVMVGVGVLWALQGMGYVDGGFTADNPTFATLGAILAGLGVALGFVVVQGWVSSRR